MKSDRLLSCKDSSLHDVSWCSCELCELARDGFLEGGCNLVPCGSCALRYTRVVSSELFDVMFETYTFASHVRCQSCGFNFSVICSNTFLHHNMSHGNVMQSSQTCFLPFPFITLIQPVSS